jgi:hypothetical protein
MKQINTMPEVVLGIKYMPGFESLKSCIYEESLSSGI